jgi:hypothetical protein
MNVFMKKFITAALGIAALLIGLGIAIGSSDYMPSYAVVFLDDATKTYIALPCVEEWRSRPTRQVDIIRRGTAGEARQLGYKVDEKCRDAGGYIEDGRSLAGLILVWLGVLPPLKHWWDQPYRIEDGSVIYPGRP